MFAERQIIVKNHMSPADVLTAGNIKRYLVYSACLESVFSLWRNFLPRTDFYLNFRSKPDKTTIAQFTFCR